MTTVTIRGVRLDVDERGGGDGVPFVWGHGLTSSRAAEDEFPLVDFDVLATGRRVIRYDARGHGNSGDLTDASEGDWAELALDQVDLLAHLEVPDVVIGGASMGAATALHAALQIGPRLRGLVLMIPPTAWETRAAQVELYESMASVVERSGVEPLIAAGAQMPPPDPLVHDEGWTARRATAMRAADPARLAAAFRGAGSADLPARNDLRTITAPTLVLGWSGDPGHPETTATALDELLPNVETSIARTRGDIDAWTARIDAFLRSVDVGR